MKRCLPSRPLEYSLHLRAKFCKEHVLVVVDDDGNEFFCHTQDIPLVPSLINLEALGDGLNEDLPKLRGVRAMGGGISLASLLAQASFPPRIETNLLGEY